jgi:hypothetical protein
VLLPQNENISTSKMVIKAMGYVHHKLPLKPTTQLFYNWSVFNLRLVRKEKGGQDGKDKGKDERKERYRCERRRSSMISIFKTQNRSQRNIVL